MAHTEYDGPSSRWSRRRQREGARVGRGRDVLQKGPTPGVLRERPAGVPQELCVARVLCSRSPVLRNDGDGCDDGGTGMCCAIVLMAANSVHTLVGCLCHKTRG